MMIEVSPNEAGPGALVVFRMRLAPSPSMSGS
jgi:hypothetical protein